MQFSEQFVSFIQQWSEHVLAHQPKSAIEHDIDWPSPCEDEEDVRYGFRMVSWKPVACSPRLNFEELEAAIGIKLHPDLWTFYGMFFSQNIKAEINGVPYELLQVWNTDDFERLQKNIIGHVLAKQRLRQPITVFIGLTDNQDELISLDNESGAVCLERAGKIAHQELASNLGEFLSSMTFSTY